MKPIIVWFRHDLRLADNPALAHACQTGAPVIPLYILEETENNNRSLGAASLWWLHHSLKSLQTDLEKHKNLLILKKGKALTILTNLIKETGANQIFWNRRYDGPGIAIDRYLKKHFTDQKIICASFNGALLNEPWDIKNKQGTSFKVFTPFWKHCLAHKSPDHPLPVPEKILKATSVDASVQLESWNLLPTRPNWAKGFESMWRPGEAPALQHLDHFLNEGLTTYKERRNTPSEENGTSLLSPYLQWGNISPRQIWHAVQPYLVSHSHDSASLHCFLSELGWREFSYHLLYYFPHLAEKPLRQNFAEFPWDTNPEALKKWQKGLTGYPIVDAGMRQLWHTGWMHNRVRMIVASFLIKHLLLPWQQGEEWFWDTLVDADPASNSMNWQWVAGCGADAAPYFRIFNPMLQGEKFDPKGDYVRRWVPELKGVETDWIHEPWKSPKPIKGYPAPVVDHIAARNRALTAYDHIKNA